MTTLTGRNTRTIVGYVVTLLDYPRWVIAREVDFTECHLGGSFDASDRQCSSCHFGAACCWLHADQGAPAADAPLDDLLEALRTSVEFLRTSSSDLDKHARNCECDTCKWLQEAQGFLRRQRHKA
jgi:hypothetical protein